MMDADGAFVGQVCHIEAAEEGGERFNALMSNEDRRAVSNLMLMCYAHHVKTNDVAAFPVEKLREMKADHERRFSNPDRAMLATLTDWTNADTPKLPLTLAGLNDTLQWRLTSDDLLEPLAEVIEYTERFKKVPIETRMFLRAVIERAWKMRDEPVVVDKGWGVKISLDDIQDALRLGDDALSRSIKALANYRLGDLDQIDGEFGDQHAIRIADIGQGVSWMAVAEYCEAKALSLGVLTDDLDFSRLDG